MKAMVEFTIGESKFEGVFRVSPQLTNYDILEECAVSM
jgi:hypothetical protein